MTEPNSEVFEVVVNNLLEQQSELEKTKNDQEAGLASTKVKLRQVSAAIAALNGPPKTKRGPKPKPTNDEIVGAVEAVLVDGTVLDRKSLMQKVMAQLSDRSQSGFAGRLDEALTDPRFSETDGGYRLLADGNGQSPATTTGWSHEEPQ